MEEEENTVPPFWLQTNDTLQQIDHRRRRHLLHRSTSIFLNSGALVVFLLVIALVFIFIVIPSVFSFTSHVFRPQLVKKSWDSLNLVLVLFAIVCGFLSRNSNENTNSYEDQSVSIGGSGAPKSNPSTPRQWYENQYSDRTTYMTRLRSSSSYPDLRQESNWVSRDDRWRSYDDSHVNSYRISSSADQGLHYRRPWPQEPEPEQQPMVDRNFREEGSYSQPAPPSQSFSSPPEPPPLPPASPPRPVTPPQPPKKVGVKRKPKRSNEALGENERISTSTEFEAIGEISYPPPSPIPIPTQTPPPPPISMYEEMERKSSGKNEKKRGVVSKEFLISSLRRRKKKQRQKSVENFDAIIISSVPSSSSSLPLTSPPSQAPPPPPPPPPSAFHNLFSSKKGKTKKSISQPQPPSPPPPPPRKHTSTVSASRTKPSSPIRGRRFPSPATTTTTSIGTSSIGVEYDNVNRGNESPLIPIPPPPPPPPFKLPAWKFVRHGDFVRINSNNSSRSGSPDLEDGEDSGGMETSPVARNGGGAIEVGESSTAMFCPSPDVNSKADTFIARFRAGLKLEKMNSAKERKSTLGPQSSPTPHLYKD